MMGAPPYPTRTSLTIVGPMIDRSQPLVARLTDV
jgi:hypothetical protein